MFINKNWKWVITFATTGFVVTISWATYQVLMQNHVPRNATLIDWAFIVLCPESIVSMFLVDWNIGTESFYWLYFVLGLVNAWVYGGIAAGIIGFRELFSSSYYRSGRLATGSRVASSKWPAAKRL
jgi:hypothetical protein